MKSCVTDIDRDKSLQTIAGTVRVLVPELVIFASRFAAAVFGPALRERFPDLQVEFVCHPGSPFHWRAAGYAHGRTKFLTVLRSSFVVAAAS